MLNGIQVLALFVLFLVSAGAGAAELTEAPEEIVVRGRLPGPPLWRVSSGDRTLWIFPYLSPIPKDMNWESERVARVIAEAQEVISMPESDARTSPLLLLNPVNLVRGYRLMKRISRNPDGGTLEENLPPELYARFAALRARYFPREDKIENWRPLFAGGQMSTLIRNEEDLVDGGDILKSIRRLIRRNRDIKRTEIIVEMDLRGSYGDLAERVETLMASLSPEQEQECFEQQVRHMEEDLDEMKSRANTWAQGYVDEFRNIPLVFDEANACSDLLLGSAEKDTFENLVARLNQMWLDAVESALATNTSTFAILDINELLRADGLLSQLKARGYEVREP